MQYIIYCQRLHFLTNQEQIVRTWRSDAEFYEFHFFAKYEGNKQLGVDGV